MGKHLGKARAFRFDSETDALLMEMAKRYGGQMAAVKAGLNALTGRNAITPEEALEALALAHGLDPPRRRTKQRT